MIEMSEDSSSEFVHLLKTCAIVSSSETAAAYASKASSSLSQSSSSTRKLREIKIILSRSNAFESGLLKRNHSYGAASTTATTAATVVPTAPPQVHSNMLSSHFHPTKSNHTNQNQPLKFDPSDQFILRNALPTTAKNYLRLLDKKSDSKSQQSQSSQNLASTVSPPFEIPKSVNSSSKPSA